MKLPETVRQQIHAVGGYKESVSCDGLKRDEAIVRDCVKALNKFERCTTTNCVAAEMLLARYGLEPKP